MTSGPVVFNAKIRNRILVRILAAASLVLVAMGLVLYLLTRQLLHAEVTAKSEAMVTLVAASMERWLVEKSAALAVLADVEAQYTAPHPAQRAYFTMVGHQIGDPPGVYMGYEGGPFVSTKTGGTLPPNYDHHHRPWYQDAVAQDRLIFTAPYVDARTQRLVMTLAAPVKNAQRRIGVIAADLFIDVLVQQVSALRLGEASRAYLVDRAGLYITHPQHEVVLTGTIHQSADAEVFRAFLAADRPSAIYAAAAHYTLISRIPSTAWFLIFHLPYSEVQQPLQTLSLLFGVGVLLTLGVLGGIVVLISRIITRPILRLATGANAILDGDFTYRLPIPSRDEIGLVTSSFNHMAAGLKDRDFIKATFGRYLSPDVVHALLTSPGGLRLGGELRDLTMLVSDLRGFSSMVARLDPHTVVQITNRYLERMIDVITRYGGTVDEFQGDGILAFFGAPLAASDDPERAVACAIAMQNAMAEVNAEQHRLGLPELAMGIGINMGAVIVGNIGSEQRTKYGAMGSAINTAYRIESYTVSGQILISPELYARVHDMVDVQGTIEVQFKGVEQPLTLYDIRGMAGPYRVALRDKPQETLTPLSVPLALTCYRLHGKAVSAVGIAGQMTAVGLASATVVLDGEVAVHDNLQVLLERPGHAAHEAYAKVLACTSSEAVLAFTMLTEDVQAFLATHLGPIPTSVTPGAK
jgi:sigma-B regulation protein RsbU (phosphoserine phosphatase)